MATGWSCTSGMECVVERAQAPSGLARADDAEDTAECGLKVQERGVAEQWVSHAIGKS